MCGGNSLDLRGETAGTGEQLAQFILDDLKTGNPHKKRRMLYLTGDKNRDTVPNILSSDKGKRLDIELDPIQVYETHGTSTFASDLDSLFQRSKPGRFLSSMPYQPTAEYRIYR
jgi:uroporphyrinogen-III synthase